MRFVEHIASQPESATAHLNNARAVVVELALDASQEPASEARTRRISYLQALTYRLEQAVEQLKLQEQELLELRSENQNLLSAIGAPRPVSSSTLIDTHRGDTLAVVMSDGSVWKHAPIVPQSHGRFENRYEWIPVDPIPGSKAALVPTRAPAPPVAPALELASV